ncbi:hypothetical protein Dimus_038287 [Dionaea muscipula]
MNQPEGYVDNQHKDYVCKLIKSLYGLKQAPRQWYKRFDTFVTAIGFKRSSFDVCLYYASTAECPIYLLLYVDDMLLISKSKQKISDLKQKLSSEFDMKDLGNARKILGIEIERDRKNYKLKLHQSSYVKKVCSKFNVINCKPVSMPLAGHFILNKEQSPKTDSEKLKMENIPYLNAIGSVMFSMISTRPDLSFSISLLSRYMSNPGIDHWVALKWLLRYLNSSISVGLLFGKWTNSLDLAAFVDSDYAGDRDSRKSTTSYVVTLAGNCISWKSQLQPLVALSSTEAEYIAITDCFKEAIWIQGLLKEISVLDRNCTVYTDSQSALHLCKNPVHHERTKHVDVRFHFVRDIIAAGTLDISKVPTEDNPADMGTKIVTYGKFRHCLELLHIR